MNFKKIVPDNLKKIYTNLYYYFFIKNNKYNVMNDNQTIEKIINDGYSISRFGDGEIKWLLEIEQNSFQNNDKVLSERLKEVLLSNMDNFLVCIPEAFNQLKGYKKSSSLFWKTFIRRHGKQIVPYLSKNKIYGSANFTRWYMEYEDKDKKIMDNKIKAIKKIWENKNVVIVEGENTKMGIGNDLFSNCNSLERIICPSKNAYKKYNEILNKCIEVNKEKIFLIALGPTATVLAYDLAKYGYKAIDIGHLDIEYEWFLKGADTKIIIKGKSVNELGIIDVNDDISNEEYKESIIADLRGEKNEN